MFRLLVFLLIKKTTLLIAESVASVASLTDRPDNLTDRKICYKSHMHIGKEHIKVKIKCSKINKTNTKKNSFVKLENLTSKILIHLPQQNQLKL